MSYLFRLNNSSVCQKIISNGRNQLRSITNSQKNRSTTATIADTINQHATTTCETASTTKKPWMSYGFDHKDKAADRNAMKASFFFSVTLCIVWGTFVWSYLPDTQMRDWAQREGFLELRRREKAGIDLVCPNYVHPDCIKLPSDSSLGDTEIII